MSNDEVVLEGGNIHRGQVVRVGDTVRRPTGTGSAAVHAVLSHLANVGYEHAPRFLGIDGQGREVLSFLPGLNVWESKHQLLRTADGVRTIGRFVRDLHDALATFDVPADVVWVNSLPDPEGGERVIHGDIAPWNLVADPDSLQCGVIDWDTASPGRLIWELAYTMQTVAHLWGDPPPWSVEPLTSEETAGRIRALGDGYGMDEALVVDCVRFSAERSRVMSRMIEERVSQGEPAFQEMLAEGHADAWSAGATAIDERCEDWLTLL